MSVVIRGIELTNNVEERRSVVVETILKPLLSKQNSLSKESMEEEIGLMLNRELSKTKKKLLDFRDKKLPPSLIMFAQVILGYIKYFYKLGSISYVYDEDIIY